MRRTNEEVGRAQQLANALLGLAAMQRDSRNRTEALPIIPPSLSADNVEARVGKSQRAQRLDQVRCRCKVLSRFYRAQSDQPQGAVQTFGAAFRVQSEDVTNRRPVERDGGV